MEQRAVRLSFWDIPRPVRRIILIGVLILVVIVIIKFRQYQRTKEQREEVKDIKDELKNVQQKPSYSDAQYKTWSNEIEGATKCNAVGLLSAKSTVVDIMDKMMNDADVYKIVSAFGVRTFDCWVNPYVLNLSGLLKSAGYTAQVNENLKKHGIKYRF